MSTVYLSKNANKILQDYITQSGHKLILIEDMGKVYPEVATHPDIYMCKLGGLPPSPVFSILNEVLTDKPTDLGYRYPENIKYNAVCMGNFFIHNLRYTAPTLLDKAKTLSLNLIDVKQGYTKCNMVVLNDHYAITADEGILNSVNKKFTQCSKSSDKIHLLSVSPGHVKLEGFPYGFLGGASGRVDNEIIFNGNLKAHPDYEEICEFIASQDLKLKYFEEYQLEDIGSIIEEI